MELLNSETWNRKQKGEFLGALLAALDASLVKQVTSSVVKRYKWERI